MSRPRPSEATPTVKRRRPIQTWLESRSRSANVARTILPFVLLIIVWEAVARFLVTDRLILAPFSDVIVALRTEMASGALWTNSLTTVGELAMGFPAAVLIGIALGVLLAANRGLQQILDPLLTAMYSVPIVALAPLFISWLGFGIESKVILVILVSVFPVIINTEVGLRSTDPALIEAARSFNASPFQVFSTVTFPFSIPFIIGGLRVGFARALVGVIVAEFFGAYAGFGFAILSAQQTFNTAQLLAYVLLLAAIGMVSSVGLRAWERHLAPWQEVSR